MGFDYSFQQICYGFFKIYIINFVWVRESNHAKKSRLHESTKVEPLRSFNNENQQFKISV